MDMGVRRFRLYYPRRSYSRDPRYRPAVRAWPIQCASGNHGVLAWALLIIAGGFYE